MPVGQIPPDVKFDVVQNIEPIFSLASVQNYNKNDSVVNPHYLQRIGFQQHFNSLSLSSLGEAQAIMTDTDQSCSLVLSLKRKFLMILDVSFQMSLNLVLGHRKCKQFVVHFVSRELNCDLKNEGMNCYFYVPLHPLAFIHVKCPRGKTELRHKLCLKTSLMVPLLNH